MTEQKIIELTEALKQKQRAAKMAKRSESLLETRAGIDRHVRSIQSVIDRLWVNFNNIELPHAAEFLENTIAEAELFIL